MNVQELLNDTELKEQFRQEYYENPPGSGNASGKSLEKAFEDKINELLNNEPKHYWDCKCLIHA